MIAITQRQPTMRRLSAAVFLCCVFALSAGAEQRGALAPLDREVLTLDEAARLLRVPASELEQLARHNQVPARRIAQRWRFNRQALLAWLNGDWQLITTAVPPAAEPLSPQTMEQVTGAGTNVAQSQSEVSNAPPPTTDQAAEPIGEAPEEDTAVTVFLRGQKVLLAPGEMTVNFGQFYSQSSNQQLALLNGDIGLATVEQEALSTVLLGRIGVIDETELLAGATFSYLNSDAFLGSQKIADSSRTEFGDVRLGVRRTLLKEGPGRPDIIASLDGRIPTGHTSYSVGGGLTFVKSIDPVALFANANYRRTFSRDFDNVTRLEPKDRFDATLGYALALNDTLTLSTSISGVFTDETRFSNAELRRRNLYSLQFGLTTWVAKGFYLAPSISFDLSEPGDSFAFGITVPYTFTPSWASR